MLYLNPPFHVVDGVSLMPDHADPLQFYYLPLSPHLTLLTDPATNQRVPQVQLIEFKGMISPTPGAEVTEVTGGFLNFDCNLGADPGQLAEIGRQLQGIAGLREPPRLAPVPVIDGAVRMMLLGAESPDPDNQPKPPITGGAPVPPVTTPKFVVKINQAGKPSLYGDNQASFSVQLDQAGAVIMRQALMGEMSPIGVIYDLTFVGLRPAYNVTVTADWNRVQTHLEENFGTNLIVFSSQIDEVVDKLVEDKVITIEGDLFVAEGDGSGGGEASRYEQALTECREMVTTTFFTPSLEPMDSERGGALRTFQRVSQTLATGGLGSAFTYGKTDLTRIDDKSLNINMRERTAVLRTIHPQAHLAGLARIITEEGLDASRFIMQVDLEDDFYKRRRVRVIPRVDFAAEHIESINVALTYGGETRNVVFDAQHASEQPVDWASVLQGGDMVMPVAYHYDVGFDASFGSGRPTRVSSGELAPIPGDVVEVDPRRDGLYDVMLVPINVVDTPWELYPTVELSCRYTDADHGIAIEDRYELTSAQAAGAGSWPVYLADPSRRGFAYRLVYHGADGRQVDRGWTESTESQIRVGDPYPRRRTVTISVPAGMFTQGVQQVFLTMRYSDPVNNVAKEEQYSFTGAEPPRKFSVELVDPTRRDVTFAVTMVYTDGRVQEVPESTTTQDLLVLREDLKGHRSIALRAEPKDFAAAGLKEIVVETRYADEVAQLSYADNLTLRSPTDIGRFEFDFVDAAKDQYWYRVTHNFTNGLSKSSDWLQSDVPELVLPTG
jgi:hypothetical protein